ncbi:MAG: leucine--tRNA ligase [Bdellovibrionota bacterium]
MSSATYEFLKVEEKWKAYWEKHKSFKALNPGDHGFDPKMPKYYVLDMFPYPSGKGLHVGHPLGYIATDIVARYKRMLGFNVLHPMGFDAFGLPAEQYAIETGTHPEITTHKNIENMLAQLKDCGLSYDWDRTFSTTDPDYYRWTQWIFLTLFQSWFDPKEKKAKPIEDLIRRLESDQYRDHNSELVDSTHPSFVKAKPYKELDSKDQQAVLDHYRLAYLASINVNWCPGLGTVLANEEVTVDGRSERGNFPVYQRPLKQWMLRITAFADRLIDDLDLVDWPDAVKQMQKNWIGKSQGARLAFEVEGTDQSIEVYTTRPDTLFGATFMVMAPDHPLLSQVVTQQQKESVEDFVRQFKASASAKRFDDKTKSGVFTGAYCINPINGQKIPLWIADYVLMSYGTGAIMAVPAHDQRDFEFAKKYELSIKPVVKPDAQWLSEQGVDELTYLQHPEKLSNAYTEWNVSCNSSQSELSLNDLSTEQAKQKVIDFLIQKQVGHGEIQYKLRDWLFSRQRYWGEPFPILHGTDGQLRAVKESDLPITLPPLTDFRPQVLDQEDADPLPLLGKADQSWRMVEVEGQSYERELNTMPQWAGSCWYYLRFMDPHNDKVFVGKESEQYWSGKHGVDLYVGGVEHAVLHLLYARFWHKVLFDHKLVSTKEPFGKLFNQGYIQAYSYQDERGMYVPADDVKTTEHGFEYQGKPVTRHLGKMGKSLKNSIAPDEVIEKYGCDTFRLYEMYLGPVEQSKVWDTDAIVGVHRFLNRLWRNFVDHENGTCLVDAQESSGKLKTLLHQTIKTVTEYMEQMRFNAAIAQMITLNNELVGLSFIPKDVAQAMVLMLAPMAPHICEELWQRMGNQDSLTRYPWPQVNPQYLKADTVEIVVQINGKRRANVSIPTQATQADVEKLAMENEAVTKYLQGSTIVKVIYVPGRLVNLVVRT